METYSLLREIADSWVLLAMFMFFLGAVIWAFRPGGGRVYDEISRIPLRDEAPAPVTGCSGKCEACECTLTAHAPKIVKGFNDV